MNLFFYLVLGVGLVLYSPNVAFAATNNDIGQFTSSSLSVLITFASLASAFFLIRGGFQYITSTGKPEELEFAKKIIRNSLIGLVLVIAAGIFSALLQNVFTSPSTDSGATVLSLKSIQPVTPSNGLAQTIIDAIVGFLQAIIQSATKPVLDIYMLSPLVAWLL